MAKSKTQQPTDAVQTARPPDLSERQADLLTMIAGFIGDREYPPTVVEMKTALGWSTKSLVHYHLKQLAENGYIKRDPNTPRAIKLLPKAINWLKAAQ